MAIDRDIRRQARTDYIFKRKSLALLAVELNVSESTVRRWKQAARDAGDNWDTARAASMIAGEGLDAVVSVVVEEFMVLAQNLIEEIKAAGEQPVDLRVKQLTLLADSMNKMTASAAKLAPTISELGVAQDVISRLIDYVRSDFPQHAAAILEVLEPFGETLAEAYG